MKQTTALIESNVAKLEANPIVHTLVVYYLLAQRDYSKLFQLLHKSKQIEL